MFSRVALFALLALPAFSLATPLVARGGGSTIQCCNSIQKAGSYSQSTLGVLNILGISPAANVPVGIECTAVNVIGVGGGASCTSQQVECQGGRFSGLVVVGCTPINANV